VVLFCNALKKRKKFTITRDPKMEMAANREETGFKKKSIVCCPMHGHCWSA
jgi:hypothetical protein